MASFTFNLIAPGRYTIAVSGIILPGMTFTVNAKNYPAAPTTILSQFTATTNSATDVINGLYASTLALYQFAVTAGDYTVQLETRGGGTYGTVESATVTPPAPPPGPPSPTSTPTPTTATTTYGQIYQGNFDPLLNNPISPVFTFKIFKKGYAGNIYPIAFSTIPAVHRWDKDEPKPGIKGSSLSINLLNENNTLPITNFYGSEDDTFRGQLFWFNQKIFDGYLVCDDDSEILVDFTHEIQLSFTDNLGLLKDIAFDKAPVNFSLVFNDNNVIYTTAPNIITLGSIYANGINVGDQIKITGGTAVDGLYNIISESIVGGEVRFGTAETIGTLASQTSTFSVYRSNVYEKKTLADIIKACLLATDLELDTHVYCNLREVSQDATRSFLAQTIVTAETFMINEADWMSCYDVLEKTCKRFKLTLEQANGVWNIVRWDELRYTASNFYIGYQIPGFVYDKDFIYTGTTSTPYNYIAGKDQLTYAETGYLNRVFRPFKYDKETFNYKQPPQLLKNSNLLQVGTLLRDYPSGTGDDLKKYKEYTFPWWADSPGLATSDSYIRVVYDHFDNELERYAILKYDNIISYPIEVNKGDIIELSFSVRAMFPTGGNTKIQSFRIELTDGITTVRVQKLPASAPPFGEKKVTWGFYPYVYEYPNGDYQEQWTTITIKSDYIPFDGKLYVYLTAYPKNSLNNIEIETHYKDISFEYTALINESTKIKGQKHTSIQPLKIKNKEDEEIYLDTVPKNYLSGCLFLNSMTGVLQKRTSRWTRGYAFGESRNLGDITTFETLYWRNVPRTILEGRLYGLFQGNDILSLLTAFHYAQKPGLNFIWGRLEIDYKNNNASGTLWETHTDIEASNDNLTHDYNFEYIYEPK